MQRHTLLKKIKKLSGFDDIRTDVLKSVKNFIANPLFTFLTKVLKLA